MFNFNELTKRSKMPQNYLDSSLIMPTQHGRLTKKEWSLNNYLKCRNAEEQQKVADKILGECERIREQTEERTQLNKKTTDRRISERIGDVEFNKEELQIKRKEICIEIEEVGVYKNRLFDCLNSIRENCFIQCSACIQLREGRIGIDLIVDEVENALHNEIVTILQWQNCIEYAIEESDELMRRLRAVKYALDVDLEHKEYSIAIEREGANLKPSNLSLAVRYSGLDPANISKGEWEIFSIKNLENATKEICNSLPVRVKIDHFLKKVSEDLKSVHSNCNRAFQIRILETKNVKQKLEDMLAETIRKIEELTNSTRILENALNDKKGYIALANTRLGMRAQRPGVELVKDAVCQSLHVESKMLKLSTEQLIKMLEEVNTSIRYLRQTETQLEEDIKIKTQSLKIDEVECMTVRESMSFYEY